MNDLITRMNLFQFEGTKEVTQKTQLLVSIYYYNFYNNLLKEVYKPLLSKYKSLQDLTDFAKTENSSIPQMKNKVSIIKSLKSKSEYVCKSLKENDENAKLCSIVLKKLDDVTKISEAWLNMQKRFYVAIEKAAQTIATNKNMDEQTAVKDYHLEIIKQIFPKREKAEEYYDLTCTIQTELYAKNKAIQIISKNVFFNSHSCLSDFVDVDILATTDFTHYKELEQKEKEYMNRLFDKVYDDRNNATISSGT